MRIRTAAIMGAVLIIAAGLTACAGSSNATACKLYEHAYNQMADGVKAVKAGTLSKDALQAIVNGLPDDFSAAYDKAHGDVAVAMRDSVKSAAQLASDDEAASTAGFMDTDNVKKACTADGAPITFDPMK